MSIKTLSIAALLCAGLAGCGNSVGEQVLGGATIGAGAAALTSGSLAKGAAIGAAGNVTFCKLYPNQCS